MERQVGYTVLKRVVRKKGGPVTIPVSLESLEGTFSRMQCAGVPASEHYSPTMFKNALKNFGIVDQYVLFKPCECVI